MAKLDFRLQIIVVFVITVVVRLSIFYGVSMPTGDVGEFATFVREISLNGGNIPYSNTIYFPGSRYIYPPLIFLGVANLNILLGRFITLPTNAAIYELYYFTILISSAQAAFLYWYLSKKQDYTEKILTAAILIFFDVSLYSLSWGGYPDIIATFMLLLLLFFLDNRRKDSRSLVYASIMFVLIAFTHDLTYFFTVLTVLGVVVFDCIKRDFRTAGKTFAVLLAGGIAGAVWWLPRMSFVLSAFTVSTSQGTGPFPIFTSGTAVLQIIPYLLPIVVLAAIEFAAALRQRKFEPMDAFTISFFCTASALVFLIKDPTLSARIILYSYTLALIILLKNLGIIKKTELFKGSWIMEKKKATALILALIAVVTPAQIYLGSASVHFFNSGQYAYNQELIDFGSTHFNEGTILAPQIGTYLSAIDGSTTIIYTGFLAGHVEVTERNAAVSVILFSTSHGAFQNISKYNMTYIVIETSLLNHTIAGGLITFPEPYYTFSGHFGEYSVYRINTSLIPK